MSLELFTHHDPVPPFKDGSFLSLDLTPPRFEKDSTATEEALRARGAYLDLIEPELIGKLERPSLISSMVGDIERVLLTIPGWIFFEDEAKANEENAYIRRHADAFRALLRDLPGRFVVLTNEAALERLAQWLAELGASDRTEIVSAPDTMRFTVWAEDAYTVCRDTQDQETFFVEPASFTRGDDAYIADIVSANTNLERTQARLYFQGGNVLIGDDFWMIGADYPRNSLKLGYIKQKDGESVRDAVVRAYGGALDPARRFLTIGSRIPVPQQVSVPFQQDGQTWKEIRYFGNHDGTVQPLFHIDMFLTLAGRDDQNRPIVLVGDPAMAAEALGQPLSLLAMPEVFKDIADQLETLGFKVVRNPIPLVYVDKPKERVRLWYFATSNNALVQVSAKKEVWLPTYGHEPWPELAATDALNKSIWEGLGFQVHQLPDFHVFAANLGAVHCIKKYLGRGAAGV